MFLSSPSVTLCQTSQYTGYCAGTGLTELFDPRQGYTFLEALYRCLLIAHVDFQVKLYSWSAEHHGQYYCGGILKDFVWTVLA